MKFIILDTTKETSAIYLVIDDKIKKIEIAERNKLSELLLLRLNELLESESLKPRDLDFVGIVNNPGSYTSIRIGITTANFLSYSLNIPLYEVKGLLDIDKIIKNANIRHDLIPPGSWLFPKYALPPVITKRSRRF